MQFISWDQFSRSSFVLFTSAMCLSRAFLWSPFCLRCLLAPTEDAGHNEQDVNQMFSLFCARQPRLCPALYPNTPTHSRPTLHSGLLVRIFLTTILQPHFMLLRYLMYSGHSLQSYLQRKMEEMKLAQCTAHATEMGPAAAVLWIFKFSSLQPQSIHSFLQPMQHLKILPASLINSAGKDSALQHFLITVL